MADEDEGRVDEGGEGTAVAEPEAPAAPEPAVAESGGDEGLDAPFALDQVPEEYRDHVQRLDRQYKSRFTQKMQELGSQRQEAEAAMELQKRLESDDEDIALAALNEIAEQRGFASNLAEDEGKAEQDLGELPEAVKEAIETTQRLNEEAQARQRREQGQILRAHVNDGLGPLRTDDGSITQERERAATFIALAQPQNDGLPDIGTAVELVQAIEAAAVQQFIESRKDSPPAPDASGGTGVSRVDTSTEKGRFDSAMKVASRHLDG